MKKPLMKKGETTLKEKFIISYKIPGAHPEWYTPCSASHESFEDAKQWIDDWRLEKLSVGEDILAKTTKFRIAHSITVSKIQSVWDIK